MLIASEEPRAGVVMVVKELDKALDDVNNLNLTTTVNLNYASAVAYRAAWMGDRKEAYNYYEHKQWPRRADRRKKIQVTLNRIKAAIDSQMGILSKSKMMVSMEGRGPEDYLQAEIRRNLFEWSVEQDDAEFQIFKCLFDSRKCGLGWLKEIITREDNSDYPRMKAEYLQSDEVLVEPGAMGDQYEDADWMIHHRRFTVRKLKQMYPFLADKIRSDAAWTKEDGNKAFYSSHIESDLAGMMSDGIMMSPDKVDMAAVKEMWYKRYETATVNIALTPIDEFELDIGEEIPPDVVQVLELEKNADYIEELVPRSRIWIATVVNNLLASNRPSPYKHNRFPFVTFKANIVDKYSYPQGDIAYLIELQDVYNKLVSVTIDNAIRNHNAGWIIDANAVDPRTKRLLEKYGAFPGIVIERKRGAKVERVQPGALSDGFLMLARQISASFDEISGIHNIYRAQMPYDTSGKGLEELRTAADVYHIPKSSPVQSALTHWGRLRFSNMQQFMKMEQAVKIDARLAKILDQTPQRAFMQSAPNGQAYYTVNQKGLPEGSNVPVRLNDIANGEYDVKIELAADFAASKKTKVEMSLGLKKMQVIDNQAVLEDLEYPNAEAVLERTKSENELLNVGQMAVNDPVAMAVLKDPNLHAQVEALVKARQGMPGPTGGNGTAMQPPAPGPVPAANPNPQGAMPPAAVAA